MARVGLGSPVVRRRHDPELGEQATSLGIVVLEEGFVGIGPVYCSMGSVTVERT
jgi:hypothetical protein